MYQEIKNKTLPQVFISRVKSTPNEIAYRVKKFGIYLERTWLDFYNMVANCAKGFMKLGLRHGEFVVLIGDPCEEYTICELATQFIGAITLSLHPNFSSEEIKNIFQDIKPSILVIENLKYLESIGQINDRFSFIRNIILINTKGLFEFEHPGLVTYKDLIKISEDKFSPEIFEEITNKINPNDGLFIALTSGVTGKPKGVLITHGKHLLSTYALIGLYPLLTNINHRTVAYLPMSYAISKMILITLPLLTRVIPHYGEETEPITQTFFEVAPTLLFTTPAYLKKLASNILLGIENSSWLKRFFYHLSLKFGRNYIKKLWEETPNLFLKLIYFICYQVIFRPILNKIGFNKLKIIFSTGSFLPNEVFTLWRIYGLNVLELYNLTETGVIAGQEPNLPKPEEIGKPAFCYEIKISKDGEILVRGESIFEGYWSNSKLIREVFDSEGWFRTGDFGELTPEGNIRILGRVNEIIRTSNGEMISISYIENLLKSSHYINEAIVFRTQRDYLIALIEVNFDTISNWAKKQNIQFTNYLSLVQNKEVVRFIGIEIENMNKSLRPIERIKKYKMLPVELIPGNEDGILTHSRKINRKKAFENFKDLIESINQ